MKILHTFPSKPSRAGLNDQRRPTPSPLKGERAGVRGENGNKRTITKATQFPALILITFRRRFETSPPHVTPTPPPLPLLRGEESRNGRRASIPSAVDPKTHKQDETKSFSHPPDASRHDGAPRT